MNAPVRIRQKQAWAVEEFLSWEEQQPERWELRNPGPWRMMVGAPYSHSKIVGNVWRALDQQLRGGPCDVHRETFKVSTGKRVYYPDVLVRCGPIDPDATLTDAPRLVVEVLSPSTEDVDFGEKREAYLALPSLEAYVIVSQVPRRLDMFARTAAPLSATAPGDVLTIPGLGVTLEFDDMFEGLPTDLSQG
jgi:Uma2 family endonuclease